MNIKFKPSDQFGIGEFIPLENEIVKIIDSPDENIYVVGDGKNKVDNLPRLQYKEYEGKKYLVPINIQDKRILYTIND